MSDAWAVAGRIRDAVSTARHRVVIADRDHGRAVVVGLRIRDQAWQAPVQWVDEAGDIQRLTDDQVDELIRQWRAIVLAENERDGVEP